MNECPSRELENALENLTAVGESPIAVLSSQLKVQEGKIVTAPFGTLKKTIKFTCDFLTTAFSALSSPRKDDLYETIIHSSEIIKKHATLLHLWESGTVEQRRFSAYAKSAIAVFNAFVENSQSFPLLSNRFFRFFYTTEQTLGKRLTKIDVAPRTPLCMHISTLSSTQFDPVKMLSKLGPALPKNLTQKVGRLRESFLPVQARELFLMKAISLLEKNGLATHEEARVMVRGAIVETVSSSEKGIHLLSLLLHPYPGRTIEIQGSFMGRIPLTDRFQISLRSPS